MSAAVVVLSAATTNLGVTSSNLFGRAKTPQNQYVTAKGVPHSEAAISMPGACPENVRPQ